MSLRGTALIVVARSACDEAISSPLTYCKRVEMVYTKRMKVKLGWGGLPYERRAYELLSLYRLFAYVVAAVTILLILPSESVISQLYLILGLVGVYTLFKTFSPLRIYEKDIWTYLLFGGDVLVCLLLPLLTGGLNSGFLLYSLCPILTASLLLEQRLALSTSTLFSLAFIIAHTLFSYGGAFTYISRGNLLTLFIAYAIISFLIPILTYRTNINVHRHIEGEAIFQERKRIAREMHDNAAQKLAYLNMKAKLLEDSVELAEIKEVIEDIYHNTRESIDNLYAEEIPRVELAAAVREKLDSFDKETGIQTELSFSTARPALSPSITWQLLRILQEALANIKKHAGASRVWVRLERDKKGIRMSLKDNGCGFSPPRNGDWGGYHGLRMMKERAEETGGEFDISTAPGEGTEIKISIPL